MKRALLAVTVGLLLVLMLLPTPTGAQDAKKPCDELKSEIAAKLDAKGVKGYTLDIVANDDVKDQTVVGSCDAGTRKIVYKR